MIKNVVFDMGGVLIDYAPQKTLKTYFPEKYHDVLDKYVFSASIWQEMDNGLITTDEAIPMILEKIPEETRPLIKTMIDNFYPYMPPFAEMEDFVRRVKASGYPVYLLSNASARFFDCYMDVPALCLMDGFFISALYKLLKPQQEIYAAFCSKFSLKPEECFFIDDMQRNIDGARQFGIKGHVFHYPDIASLEESLNAEGVKLI